MKIVIVVIAYTRHLSLNRLLNSIEKAEVDGKADLIISLEGNSSKEVLDEAEAFSSPKFNKVLIKRKEQLGLRKHVIACGDLVNNYDGIIILEDDLLVDKYFYLYAKASLGFYKHSENIAGVALYSHEYNEFANLPFRPMHNGFDTYPIQVPCSWGQCWSRQQWHGFKNWYLDKTKESLDQIVGLPEQVKAWSESSWKKYFHGYMVENDLYFMYPYVSLSTNCSDAGGTHIASESNLHQVCLPAQKRPMPNFSFCPADFMEVNYDAFFEPNGDFVYRCLDLNRDIVSIDFQGIKSEKIILKKELCLTSKKVTKYESSYPLRFKPVEFNLEFPTKEKLELNLCKSVDVLLDSKKKFSFYQYYIGMSIINKSISLSYSSALIKKLSNKILKYIRILIRR